MLGNARNLPLYFRRPLAILVVTLLLLLSYACGPALSRDITDQLNAWKLLPQPERLTELYFTQQNNLPSTYVPGQQQDVSFTVHDLEYAAIPYSYTIVEQDAAGDKSQMLSSGQFVLHQDQYEQLHINVTLQDVGANAKVVVRLTNVPESIDYLVSRQS